MPLLDLSVDEVLSTTRAVRKRLDLTRPVEPELLDECLGLALQAPTASNSQHWHFVVVTDPEKRQAIGQCYRARLDALQRRGGAGGRPVQRLAADVVVAPPRAAHGRRARARDLLRPRPLRGQAERVRCSAALGSVIQAGWSLQLAARSRGLGSVWTTLHLWHEREAAEALGIPYDDVTQVALIPIAHTIGTDFKPAARRPMDEVVHRDRRKRPHPATAQGKSACSIDQRPARRARPPRSPSRRRRRRRGPAARARAGMGQCAGLGPVAGEGRDLLLDRRVTSTNQLGTNQLVGAGVHSVLEVGGRSARGAGLARHRPRGHGDRVEQGAVVAVDVRLHAVHDLGPVVAHVLLDRAVDVDVSDRVERMSGRSRWT